jgi:hypothetical protein
MLLLTAHAFHAGCPLCIGAGLEKDDLTHAGSDLKHVATLVHIAACALHAAVDLQRQLALLSSQGKQ